MYNIAIDYSHQARSVTDARTTPAILALPVRDLSHVDHKLGNSKKVMWSEKGAGPLAAGMPSPDVVVLGGWAG